MSEPFPSSAHIDVVSKDESEPNADGPLLGGSNGSAPRLAHDALGVLERISDAYIVLDRDYRFVYANPAAERDMRKTLAEIRGRVHWEVFPASYDITAGRCYRAAAETKIPQFFQEHYRYEGLDLHMEMQAYPTDEGGVAVFWRDVTSRVRALEALRASEERYALAARATRNAIWDWEIASGRITWNEGLCAQFGYAREDVMETADWWIAAIHDDDRDAVLSSINVVLDRTDGGEEWRHTYRFRRGDGAYADVNDRGFVSRDAAGVAVRMIGAMEDVTEQRLLEEQLRQSQKLEAIGQLAGGIAHDFNNLLTVINGNLEFVRAGLPSTHAVRPDLEEVAAAAERARTLVRQLLTFSRKQQVHPRRVSASELLLGMERLLRRVIGEEIAFQVQIDPSTPYVRIDSGQFEQVVMNLVVNARDAMTGRGGVLSRHGGTLVVEASSIDVPVLGEATATLVGHAGSRRCLQLVVRDTGHGMDEQTRRRIFEPFFTTKDVGAGTGLGLATVHGIVTEAGGTIHVDSEPGAGSAFTILLPAVEGIGADAASGTIEGGRTTLPATVLLVEDEARLRNLLRRALESRNHVVLEARHGLDALDLWRRHREEIDLVLTDVRMPELSGIELVRRIRTEDSELPVVFISGYNDEGLAGRVGPRERFVEKPFTFEELLTALGQLLPAVIG